MPTIQHHKQTVMIPILFASKRQKSVNALINDCGENPKLKRQTFATYVKVFSQQKRLSFGAVEWQASTM